jgi:ribosomal protein S18 acetylase RimI-like enzyme
MLKNKFLFVIIVCAAIIESYSLAANFEIRALNYHDAQEIKEVCELFEDKDIQEMTGGKTSDSQMDLLSSYTLAEEQKYGKYFICRSVGEHKKVCGILTCVHSSEDGYAEYKAIGVHKDYRRQGIASLMMEYVENIYVKKIPVQKILIGVFPQNVVAIKCYSKQGFYIPLMDKIQTYCRIVCAKLLNKPTSTIGFYMYKDL